MNLQLNDDQVLLQDTFEKLLQNESTPERIRSAEPLGFDSALWEKLVETGIPLMRVGEDKDGLGYGLVESAILVEQAGKHLASAPIIETLISSRLLTEAGSDEATEWWGRQCEGSVVTLALRDTGAGGKQQVVPAGAVAEAVIALDGEELVLVHGQKTKHLENLGCSPLARWQLSEGERIVLAKGKDAVRLYEGAQEEWKLLTAVTLAALGRQALDIAAAYSTERKAFGQLIGSYQGLAHPMADSVTDIEGAMLLAKKAIWSLTKDGEPGAAAISSAYWWATQSCTRAVARALHLHGGYGLSLEYDVQLYHRRAKAWALVLGDPGMELENLAERLWDNRDVGLPATGDVNLDFGYGPEAEAFAEETRRFFEENLTDELRAHAHHSWEGHHPEFQKALAKAGMLLPDWPKEYGGQGRNRYEMTAMAQVFNEYGWTRNAIGVMDMVGAVILAFGSDETKSEVLPKLTGGERICCLGFSEPSGGSDVFAAKTKAVKDGDEWVISGSKMFTSGAEIADYVLLLTRTDPDAPKHAGLTMFLVPMDTPGIEVQAVYTLADERTNITYYDNVRIPDSYRLGEVNAGVQVMAHSLSNEQNGSWFAWDQRRMVERAIAWAQSTERDGKPAIQSPAVRDRLARAWVNSEVSDVLCRKQLWTAAEGVKDRSAGPMSKLFATETYIRDSADLLDLMAPESLLSGPDQVHHVEVDYRLSTATSIYAGTSEIMRSLIAENALKMPRTRQ